MDIIKQNKLAKWLIALLVVLNAATLSFLWIGKPEMMIPPPPPKERTPADMVRFLKSELNLSDGQVQEFNKLREEHFLELNPIVNEVLELKKSLMDNVFLNNNETVNKDSLAKLIGTKQSQIELLTYNHFKELVNVCGKDQARKLGRLLEGAIANQRKDRRPLGTPPPPPKPLK